jgi:hypothetical protein
MRVTIIPTDGFVSIDNIGFSEIDLSFIPNEIHAIQWYDTFGEIEYKDEFGRITRNEELLSLDELTYFDQAYAAWEVAKQKYEEDLIQQQQELLNQLQSSSN